MADQDRWGGLRPDQETELVTELWNWVIGEQKREEAAERRHTEILNKIDTVTGSVLGAVAAGFRAFADAVDRGNRR